VAQHLAGATGSVVDIAELVLDRGAGLVVVGGREAEGLPVGAEHGVEVFRSTGSASPTARASSNRFRATEPSCPRDNASGA
jgi:hypothetical protein